MTHSPSNTGGVDAPEKAEAFPLSEGAALRSLDHGAAGDAGPGFRTALQTLRVSGAQGGPEGPVQGSGPSPCTNTNSQALYLFCMGAFPSGHI